MLPHRSKYRKVCIVHGKKTKPKDCQLASYEDIHRPTGKADKCQKCGECCHVSVKVDPTSEQGIAMMQKIQQRAHILDRVGVDAKKVVKHIKETGRVPLRSYVNAGDLQWDNFMLSSACALLVPEEALAKGDIRKRLSDVPIKKGIH